MKRNNKYKEKNVTVLGKETVFDGVMKFSETLQIEGKFIGAIDSQGSLYISKNADCRVQYIKAASIVVEGVIVGSLSAADKVDLKSGSSVKGDITAGRLRIADKVSFEGSVRMVKNTGFPEKTFFSIKSDQLKEQLSRE
ncbi:bactofilin family protein [Treponema denticola]|uniref:bactofilin family protein n=1 Tax=Treponema denticola TaxID=158 RepID=UPI002106A468|nr:polymer-forming cytoskeletal protein [Treponema denticola]UTY26086.1 polymer-forming cytoskeletal family protein [Treponema denticola]